jgi:hypothetical protein
VKNSGFFTPKTIEPQNPNISTIICPVQKQSEIVTGCEALLEQVSKAIKNKHIF